MRILQRRLVRIAAAAVAVVGWGAVIVAPTNAALIHESATLGTTGQGGGGDVDADQFLGSRFSVSSTVNVGSIGGHIVGFQPQGNDLIFGAIIGLSSPTALPTGTALPGNPFAPGEVLASTTFNPGAPSSDVMVPLSITLAPGDYALVFGSGLFGATGFAGMPNNNTDISGSASYFFFSGGTSSWLNGGTSNSRFTVGAAVSAVPLPAALPLFLSALAGLGLMGWRRRRQEAGA